MSLLIKALEQAEKGKNADGKSASELSLEPFGDSSSSKQTTISPEQEKLAEALRAEEERQITQQAASVVLSAKTVKPGTSKKTIAILSISLLILILIIVEGYMYWQTLNKPAFSVPVSAPVSAKPQNETPPVVVVTEQPVTELSPPDSNQLMEKPEAPAKVDQPVLADDMESVKPKKSVYSAPVKAEPLVYGDPVNTSEDTSVKVTRNKRINTVNSDLMTAYDAFNAGDDARAQRLYRQVLQSDVRNIDALLGMAAVATRQGRNSDALGWYDKVLEVEPRNSFAQAAITSVISQSDAQAGESRIKSLLAQQPEAAYVHAALGDLYAEQNRWAAAQLSYFQAHHFDPNNPEYAFNLAVSLDQMNKPVLALQYYKKTLELLPDSGVTKVDRGQLLTRISQLEADSKP